MNVADNDPQFDDPELEKIWTTALDGGRAWIVTSALEAGHVIEDHELELATAGVAAGIVATINVLVEKGLLPQ